ncbi:hypothetical protein EGR52_12515 [bacterium]|nr:hypothetical protein [bacterium]
MIDYNKLRNKMEKKQTIEKIILELEFVFFLLKEKRLNIRELMDLNNYNKGEYLELIDIAIQFVKEKEDLCLERKEDYIYRLK